MSFSAMTGLLLGGGLGLSIVLLIAALRGWRPRVPHWLRSKNSANGAVKGSVFWGAQGRRRLLLAIGAGVLVAVITRWPVAVGAAVAVIYLWPTMFGGGRAGAAQLERLEALAVWTESLRDSIAGSVGLEQAIQHSLTAAPPVIRPPLQRLVDRMRYQTPLPQALTAYAEEFDDASADLVVAALVLNSRLRGPGLKDTLTALAVSAREELDMRRRIEEGRKKLRRAAMWIVGTASVFAGGITVFSRDYVAPYSTPLGQFMLIIVFAIFAVGLMWIRSSANLRAPARFLVSADQVDAALQSSHSSSVGGRGQTVGGGFR